MTIARPQIDRPSDSSAATAGLHDNRIDLLRPDAPELAPPGPHAIGVRRLELVNPNQIDILNVTPQAMPRYDRPLTLEIWYPAEGERALPGSQPYFDVYLRDGATRITLYGSARRGAAPDRSAGPYPLVLISHGYPGNRFLLSHLAENLASKGYVAVSIDHTDSRYHDKAAFGSTLVNRPLDQLFVLDQIDTLSRDHDSFLHGLVDASQSGLIGYSMGGYGCLIAGGAGLTKTNAHNPEGAPGDTLLRHLAGSETHEALMDPRLKCVVPVGAWGRTYDAWDAAAMAGLRVPAFFIAGSRDEVSGYETGMRLMFDEAENADRFMLTFRDAGHNAGVPIPAPVEAWRPSPALDFMPSEHYMDPVWDSVRMNNITQHFMTAYLGLILKRDARMKPYLDLVPDAREGRISLGPDGAPDGDHSHWKGFAPRMAQGLMLEHRAAR